MAGKKNKPIKLDELTQEEKMKYEIAEELGPVSYTHLSIFIRMRREFLKTFRSAVLRWRNWQALSGSSPKDSKKRSAPKI